jgi:hypothetical protein
MESRKAYFVDNENEVLYELSVRKRRELEKKHPDWANYVADDLKNTANVNEVYEFFRTHGKLLANPSLMNVWVGLTV